MERRHVPQSENRLLILYTVRLLQPATAAQLLEFMVYHDLMNYFTLQLGLCEMEEQGLLQTTQHLLGPLLSITQPGVDVLEELESLIPQSRRETVDQAAKQWKTLFMRQQQAPASSQML